MNIKKTYKITFEIDDNLIENIVFQLQDLGLKPTKTKIEKIIKENLYFSGDGFVQEPTIYDEDDKKFFIEKWT